MPLTTAPRELPTNKVDFPALYDPGWTPSMLSLRAVRAAVAVIAVALPPAAAYGDRPSGSQQGARSILAGELPAQGETAPELGKAPNLAELAGKPIRRVEVVVAGNRWTSSPRVTSVRTGEPFSAEVGRRALRELLAGGGFARAAVEAVLEGDGVVLRLHMLPRRVIATIQLSGGTLDAAATLQAAGIGEGSEVTAVGLEEIERRIHRYYAQHGFPSAKTKVVVTDTDRPGKILLSIAITPGAPLLVDRRIFVISPAADREVGSLKQRYRVSRGDRVDDRALTEADRDMTDVLRANGFRQADVQHMLSAAAGRTDLYVYLNPGPRIVPVFEGHRAFDKDDLGQALAVDDGRDTRPDELATRLRNFYIARGFLDAEVAVNSVGKPEDPVNYLVFAIREGNQVRVTKRVFPCLPPKAFAPGKIGAEIESFLNEELPGSDFFSIGSSTLIDRIFGPNELSGNRPQPLDLNPAMTYAPETYERALQHLRDLFHSKGYLNAVVGPVSILRATCSPRSKPGQCIPEPPKETISAKCLKDAAGLPLPEPPVPASLTCKPDRRHLIECSPEITLRIPIHLGNETVLYDIVFEGNKAFTEKELAGMIDLKLGDPLSTVDLENARQKVIEQYKNEGYAYADVRTVVEPSPDRTRARIRLVVTERDLVIIKGFKVRGATRTSEKLILDRVALTAGDPYKQELARTTEELIGTLGTFSSVSVSLEDPEVPQKQKEVVITVAEQLPQYIDPRVGFSTGEGMRFALEYGHRNIAGIAIAFTLRLQFNYLFEFMIPEGTVRDRYDQLNVGERLERRNTLAFVFPEIGLGPRWRFSFEGIDVRDNQRDYGITRDAFIPALSWRPWRSITAQLVPISLEVNDVKLFNDAAQNSTIRLLRAPQGRTMALAPRFNVTWDARDNPFAATRGVLLGGGVEYVYAFPLGGADNPAEITSQFLRLTGRFSGYIPIADKMSLAMSLSAGGNIQVDPDSQTYPDRLFFLGGTDSLRGFLADSVVPEDVAQKVLANQISIHEVAIRGGNFVLNPRAELRIPLTDTFQIGLFLDAGNVWLDPNEINIFTLRYAMGAGLRINTPIGPLVFDYGINLIKREWPVDTGGGQPVANENEDRGNFHFSIGLF